MKLKCFTESAYDRLFDNIPQNSPRYSSDEDWLPKFFVQEKYFNDSLVEVGEFVPYYVPGKKDDDQKAGEDFENTRRLYEAFRNLTPQQAANKLMWTYLCHAVPEFRMYIHDRWLQEGGRANTIKSRYFVTQDGGSLLNDNALSRLWWYGHLTYDEKSDNPYELTEILLMNQTICTDFMDTMNRMNYNRMRGVLTALRDFKELLDPNEGITQYFRECKKYLNRYAAVTHLEYLDYNEIHDLTLNYMVKLRDNKTSRRQLEQVCMAR